MTTPLTDLAAMLTAIVVVGGAFYAVAAWVVTPRLERKIESALAPMTSRVAAVERRVDVERSDVEARINSLVEGQGRIGTQIRDGMHELAVAIRELGDRHFKVAGEVAELRGRVEAAASAPRARTRGSPQ